MAARTLKLHPCAPNLTDDRCGYKERDISEIEMREDPRKENKGDRNMDAEKPFKREPPCPFPKVAKREVDEHGKCEKCGHMRDR